MVCLSSAVRHRASLISGWWRERHARRRARFVRSKKKKKKKKKLGVHCTASGTATASGSSAVQDLIRTFFSAAAHSLCAPRRDERQRAGAAHFASAGDTI